jgi:hypothetical protein
MQIDTASRGDAKKLRGKDESISDHDGRLWMESLKSVYRSIVENLGLVEGEPERGCQPFHGRGSDSLAAPGRPIRLADHEENLVPGLVNSRKGRNGELGRAEEKQPQASAPPHSPFWISF